MQVLLFYTQGDESGTRMHRALLTFRRLPADGARPNISIDIGAVPTLGLEGALHNAAWAYAPASRAAGGPYFYVAREGQPMPASHPDFISDHVEVARIPSHAVWDSASETRWEQVFRFGPSQSGKPRNHNAGFVRDAWGMVPDSGWLDVLWSVAEAGDDRVEWSYRMCCGRLPLRVPAPEVGTAQFVQELIARGIRMVVFDFDGVMLQEQTPGCGLDLHCNPGPHALAEGFYDLALALCSNSICMAVVTNNDRKNILPVIVSNWRWHQRPERQSDFSTIADSGIFGRVQCWDTHRGKRCKGQRMPTGNGDSYGQFPPSPVHKNGRIRLAMHWAKRSGVLSDADAAADDGVGARRTLLIDDNEENVQAFLRLGGHVYWHPKPHEGLSDKFDISKLMAPQDHDGGETCRNAIAASELGDWDWWLAEWQLTPEGGAQEHGP